MKSVRLLACFLCLILLPTVGQGQTAEAVHPPLTLPEVVQALQGGIPPKRVTTVVEKYGVDFRLDNEAEARIRAAGGNDALVIAIAKSYKEPPAPPPKAEKPAPAKPATEAASASAVVVPIYKVPGVSQALHFNADLLAGIFLGQVTNWNDEAIARMNPGVSLPDVVIVVVHRSDQSQTTSRWTEYLSGGSAEWAAKVGHGASVRWPVGLGAKGNEGVSGLVAQITGGLGYVDLDYAVDNRIAYGILPGAGQSPASGGESENLGRLLLKSGGLELYYAEETSDVIFSGVLPANWSYSINVDGNQDQKWGSGPFNPKAKLPPSTPDIAYSQTLDEKLCAQYIYASNPENTDEVYASSPCGGFPSAGRFEAKPLPDGRAIKIYTIPKRELYGTRESAFVVIEVYDGHRQIYFETPTAPLVLHLR